MNDNEKKAHDIAIVFASVMQKSIIEGAIKSNAKDINFDIKLFYNIYKEAYDKTIGLIQEE